MLRPTDDDDRWKVPIPTPPDMTNIPNAVFDYFSADPVDPRSSVGAIANDTDSPIHSATEDFLSSLDSNQVAEARNEPHVQFLTRFCADLDREARIWAAGRLLARCIASRRLDTLRSDPRVNLTSPYDQPALADLTPDDEGLVPLREFGFDGSRLLRNGHAFMPVSTTPSPNSTYWLLQSCYLEGLQTSARIRLDPFLHGPASSFPVVSYKMLVYGQSLDWDRLNSLREPEHGCWRPDAPQQQDEFTDFVWTPRESEIHFVCEEVPSIEKASSHGGRYAHVIYLPSQESISHFDFALRLYNDLEITERHQRHVRHAGKAGFQRKVFRVDSRVPRSTLSALCQAFFVWNSDVTGYFRNGCVLESSPGLLELNEP